jgi:hypothetical protein
MDRLFDIPILLGIFGGSIVAGALGLAVGLTYQPTTAAKRALEAMAVAFLGGFLAHAAVAIVLDLGDDSEGAALLAGWAFFGIPGLIDTILAGLGGLGLIDGDPFLTQPDRLLGLAAIVGTTAGALHGAYRIYDWKGPGVPQFVTDVTWGLIGTTFGTLLNLWNCFAGTRLLPRSEDDVAGMKGERRGATVFTEGFATADILTQGATISNLEVGVESADGGESSDFVHEKTHVFQNRMFGPFFTLTYAAWMVVWFLPALIVDNRMKDGKERVMGWCYFANPWEVWGYHNDSDREEEIRAATGNHADVDVRTSNAKSTWSTTTVLAVAIPFYVFLGLAMGAAVSRTLAT